MLKHVKQQSREVLLQCQFYNACVKEKLLVDLEYSIEISKEKTGYNRNMLDVVVVDCSEIIAIVEVKRPGRGWQSKKSIDEQIDRYKIHGVPVFVLKSSFDIPSLVKTILQIRRKHRLTISDEVVKYSEATAKNYNRRKNLITEVFRKFDEVFPAFQFTNDVSLEILEEAVNTLGFIETIKIFDKHKGSVREFIGFLKTCIEMRKQYKDDLKNIHKSDENIPKEYKDKMLCTEAKKDWIASKIDWLYSTETL